MLLSGGNLANIALVNEKVTTTSGFFEEAVLLQGFVFQGPRGFGDSNGLVVFDVKSDFLLECNFHKRNVVDLDRLESESNQRGCVGNSEPKSLICCSV